MTLAHLEYTDAKLMIKRVRRESPTANGCLPLVVCRLPFAVYRVPFTVYRLLFAGCRQWLVALNPSTSFCECPPGGWWSIFQINGDANWDMWVKHVCDREEFNNGRVACIYFLLTALLPLYDCVGVPWCWCCLFYTGACSIPFLYVASKVMHHKKSTKSYLRLHYSERKISSRTTVTTSVSFNFSPLPDSKSNYVRSYLPLVELLQNLPLRNHSIDQSEAGFVKRSSVHLWFGLS